MASSHELQAIDGQRQFNLLPYPRSVSLKGSPLRVTPVNFLCLAANASNDTRRRARAFCQQLQGVGFRTTLSTAEGLGPTQAVFAASGAFQRQPQLERPLRGETAKPEGYRLSITSDGALLHGADERGLFNAAATLRQLAEDNPNVPGMEIEDYPLLSTRALHLDFKGWPPTAAYLKQVLTLLSGLKINTLILEYESFFDFPSQPGLASDGALSAKELTEIELLAQDLGVTLVPLVPCLGNVGHVLRRPAYLPLREHPDYLQQYCPANPMTLEVVTAMMEDLLRIHSGKYFHIGGDEARLLGANAACKQRAKQLGGRSAVYLEYIGKVCRYLLMRERQPLVWDDMFRKMTDEQLKWLPPEVILTVWEYAGLGGRATPALLTNLDRYHRLGRPVWGAAARTPASRYEALDNIDAWAEAAELGYLTGLMTTTWTREHTCGGMFPPPESAWPAAFYAAERMWSGRQGPKRELFPEAFIMRLFGVADRHVQSRLWAAFDRSAGLPGRRWGDVGTLGQIEMAGDRSARARSPRRRLVLRPATRSGGIQA